MSDWKYVKVGDICTVERGGSPRPIDKYITNRDDGINWIKIGDTTDSMYITATAQKILPEGMKKSRYVKAGDFLLSNSMSFGRPYILKIDGCIHDGWLVLRDDKDLFDKRFLYYYLSAPTTYEKFKRMAVGGVVNNLNSEMVRGVTIPLCSKDVQIAVADKFENIDSLITARREQLAKLDELVKSRFIELFGEPLSNTKGWKTMPIVEAAPIKSQRGDLEEEIWLLNLDAVEAQTGAVLFKHRVQSTEINASTVYFTTDNVLYSKLRPYLNKVVMPDEDGVATSEMIPMLPIADLLNRAYLCYWLRSDAFVKHISEKVAGAKMPRVSMDYFRSLAIEIPPLDLQEQFAAFVEQTDKSKFEIQKSLEKLETLKKALMQKYFG